jgi:hypothetical protein
MAAACHLAIAWIPAFNVVQRFYRENAWALVGKNVGKAEAGAEGIRRCSERTAAPGQIGDWIMWAQWHPEKVPSDIALKKQRVEETKGISTFVGSFPFVTDRRPCNRIINAMTMLLRKAFAKASSLSRPAQEQLAEQLLEEIDAEGKRGQDAGDVAGPAGKTRGQSPAGETRGQNGRQWA